jgi:hypothetical protein
MERKRAYAATSFKGMGGTVEDTPIFLTKVQFPKRIFLGWGMWLSGRALPNMQKALGSIPNTAKNKQKKRIFPTQQCIEHLLCARNSDRRKR